MAYFSTRTYGFNLANQIAQPEPKRSTPGFGRRGVDHRVRQGSVIWFKQLLFRHQTAHTKRRGRYSGQHSATQERALSDNHSDPERVTIRFSKTQTLLSLRNPNLAINGGPDLCYDVNGSTLKSEWLCPEVLHPPFITWLGHVV